MKKWYAGYRWVLVTAVALQLTGCASTSRTLARWTGRDGDEQSTQVDGKADRASQGKPGDPKLAKTSPSAKSSDSQVANSKAKDSRGSTDGSLYGPTKSKSPSAAEKAIADQRTPTTKKSDVEPRAPKSAESAVASRGTDAKAPVKSPGSGSAESRTPTLAKTERPEPKVNRAAVPDPFADEAVEEPFGALTAAIETPKKKPAVSPAVGKETLRSDIQEVGHQQLPLDGLPDWAQERVDQSQAAVKKTTSKFQPVTDLDDLEAFGMSPSVKTIVPAETKSESKSPSTSRLAALANETTGSWMDTAESALGAAESKVQSTKQDLTQRASAAATKATTVASAKVTEGRARVEATTQKLSSLCPAATGEVQSLVSQLDTSETESLKRTIHRLGRMQTEAQASQPALEKLLHHPDGYVRVHAALALVRMQQVTPDVTNTVLQGLRSPDPAVRSFSASVLSEMGPTSAEALPALTAALHDKDGYVRLHAAEVMIRQPEWSYQSLQVLNECLQDRDENVRWLTTYSMAELAPQSVDAVAALTGALTDPVTKVQVGAAYALGEIGPIATSAVPALNRAAQGPNPELRTAADFALKQIRGE